MHQGWVMLGTLGSLTFALTHLLWTHLLREWCSSALPRSQHKARGSMAFLQHLPLCCLLQKGPCRHWCPVKRSTAGMCWGSGCAEKVPKMNIAATVVALECCLFLVLPSTWLLPMACCTLRRVLWTLKPALNSCELQSLSVMCGLAHDLLLCGLSVLQEWSLASCLRKLPNPVLTTCCVTFPEELKQLALCCRGWCVRTLPCLLKSEVLGVSSPCVWDAQML